jgi:uncharacterized protein (DUF362 family)
MKSHVSPRFGRRDFLRGASGAAILSLLAPRSLLALPPDPQPLSDLFWIRGIPNLPYWGGGNGNYHAGVDSLLGLMGANGLKFYRSSAETAVSGAWGMIARHDVVLIKVNAQWKYRGCTNSDVIRGLIQRILDHPDGFTGEVVIVENGQGRGSLNGDTSAAYEGDTSVHANANKRTHTFLHLVNTVFAGQRVSAFLLDPIRGTFIDPGDHVTDGYRKFKFVSYPCFTTRLGNRVELREGLWKGSIHRQNLKLINVPVLKHHDVYGSQITASLKHFYGLVSMSDGQSEYRHYEGLGRTCGKMVVSVRTPVLNIIDAIWVSYASLRGYPADTTHRANQLMASQDPVALDYWAAKSILFPIDANPRHHPSSAGIKKWMKEALAIINEHGGLYNPAAGLFANQATRNESRMRVFAENAATSFTF